jgi:CBS domain-containing protein
MVAHRRAAASAPVECLHPVGNQFLHLLGRDRFLACAFDQGQLLGRREGTNGIQVASREATVHVLSRDLLDGGGEVEQREELRDFPFTLSGLTRQVVLGEAVAVPQSGQRVGQVEGVHVEPLPVLDNLVQEHSLLLGFLNPAGDLRDPRLAGGLVAAFTGDDLVDAVRVDETDGDGLEDTESADGIRQFLLRLGVETAARLVGIRADAVAGNGESATEPAASFQGCGSGGVSGQRQRGRGAERLVGLAQSRFDELR